MAQASVSMNISTTITGYQKSLEQLKNAFNKLDPGSKIAKQIDKEIKAAEKQVNSLGNNLNPKFTSQSQLDRFIDKVNNAGDAIKRAGASMKEVTKADLNFSKLGQSTADVTEKINTLRKELDDTVNKGFKETLKNSQELAKNLKDLGVEPGDMKIGEVLESVKTKVDEAAEGYEKAKEKVQKAAGDIAEAQEQLSKMQQAPINNREQLKQGLSQASKGYRSQIQELEKNVKDGLKTIFGSDSETQKTLLDNFMKGLSLNPDTLTQHLKNLKDSIQKKLNNGTSAKSIYTILFGEDLGKSGNASALATKIRHETIPQIEEVKQSISSLAGSLTTKQLGTVMDLISQGDVEEGLKKASDYLDQAYRRLQGQIVEQKAKIQEAMNVEAEGKNEESVAQAQRDNAETIYNQLQAEQARLIEENAELRQRIEELEKQQEAEVEKAQTDVQQSGTEASTSAESFKISTQEANRYTEALDKVREREQLIGNLENAVQRWFSIYAAVRMVGQAYNAIKTTLKELDDTITEIAIVTNMTQDDLWSQMSDYTAMAKQYGASISGVYKVSQLFYQQGYLNI